ncbi:hypothetical protein CHU93_14885 [Sandarakinorhabdus cyanobacteriorum]|uniref:Type I restriction modification DNA specificity domain-containing protein n=1 Tax=Sandarakinorhabdus cyanobacteriorum TaxID=1981098 RepID=A0A255Y7A4_9SPHN|nr:restriction endonuclease subunit S [Sandarakinorhabdus cyanobacteriorum]OYQ25109.1 hypothetical protein CHU93_14885 [Sandarakinorhabdus cyanobacteriorum]
MTVTKPLGELCSIVGGGTPSRKNPAFFGGDIPWVSIKDLVGDEVSEPEEYITEEAIRSSATRIVHKGSILVATRVGLGKVAMAGRSVAINQDIKALTPHEGVLPDYLFRHMKAHGPAIERMGVGATVKGITLDDLRRLPIRVPPLDEQRRIVDLLNRASAIRRLAEAAQAKARALIPALFAEMFGDPATNPKGWPVVPLRETGVRFVGGQNLQAGDEDASQYRILKISAVTSGTFRPDEAKPAPVGHTPKPEHFVKSGDVLFSRANTVDLVGATALVTDASDNLLLPDKLWRIELPATAPVRLGFLLHFLRQPHTRQEMSRMASGTSDSMRNISQGRLKELPVMTPPRALQEQFEGIVAEASAQAVLAERASATANALTQSIMAKVFAT